MINIMYLSIHAVLLIKVPDEAKNMEAEEQTRLENLADAATDWEHVTGTLLSGVTGTLLSDGIIKWVNW